MPSEKKRVRPEHELAVAERRDDDWHALIGRTAARDEAAFAELYDRSSALVHGLVLRILREPALAEEVTLDVYLQVWRQAERYDPARGSARAWLLLLARSRAIDHRRAAAVEPRERESADYARLLPATEPGPEDHTAISERRRLVTRACIDLAPEQRQVIELAYFRGLSHSEIAAELGQPLGTVKTRIRAGMMRLRETLQKSGAATW